MSHKAPNPEPENHQSMPFSTPRPPKAGETAEEYCKACDCVMVNGMVYSRLYWEWLCNKSIEKKK